jgi:hypothetical protein
MPAAGQSLILQSLQASVDVDYWLGLFDSVKTSRATFDSHCSEVARKIYPEADQFTQKREPGRKVRQEVYSSHAARALRKWVRFIISLTAPKTTQWQQVLPEDEELAKDPAAKAFFEDLTRRIFKMRLSPRARFYETLQGTLMDFGAFGNGCFFVDEEDGRARYIPVPLSQVWIAVDHQRRVQTIFYQYEMSAAAADMKWRKVWGKSPPEKVRQNLETRPFAEMQWLHIVTPRGNVNPDSLGNEGKAWRSLHFALEDRVVVDEGGYYTMPYMFPRDMLAPNEIYGRGAGMLVLPEMGTLNAQKRTFLQSGERVAAPPILLRDDAVTLGARKINLTPWGLNGGMLDSRGNPLLRPFETGGKLDLTREMMQDEEMAIDDAFGLNLMRMLVDDPSVKTAFEVAQRLEEKGQLMGPTGDYLQSELFGVETQRCVDILWRAGDFPEVPPVVAEAGTYRIQHTSPASALMRAGEMAATTRTLQILAPFIEQDPMILKKFRPGAIADRSMEIYGGPTELLVPEEEFQEMVAQANEAAAAAQQGAMAEQGAGALQKGAQALTLLQGGQSAPAA